MNDYTSWNLKNFKKQITQSKGIDSFDSSVLSDMLHNEISPFNFNDSFKNVMLLDIKTMYEYQYFMPEIENFAAMRNHHRIDNPLILDSFDFSYKELFEFTREFFKTKDPNWYKIFNLVFNERKNNLQFSDDEYDRSYEIYFPSINYNYINIKYDQSIETFFRMVHEYTHAIADRLKYRRSYYNHYPFVELPSLFMELIASDEINSTYIGLNNDVKTYNLASIKTMSRYADDLLTLNDYIINSSVIKEYNDTVKDAMRITGESKEYIEYLLEMSSVERLMYVIPYLVAIELYYIYKKDPEKAFSILNELIMLDSIDYSKVLEAYDIHLNENTSRFIKHIKKS